ncbi:MAG: ABC transporter ATP-binding protein [Gulosibacter sp.]|uniref:ABC transporter ATP-binding protein n=1 Tax=Gulosibacter sp. TaxID=2817531 RepID=UPI003F9290CD
MTATGEHGAIVPRGALTIRNLTKRFGEKQVLEQVNLDVAPGEIVALVGPSGSGKSTLLSILTGALQADAGEILFDGAPVPTKNRPFAYMPQRDVLLPWRRILDNAGIGLEVAGCSRQAARQRVIELLEPFGLVGTERLYPRQLSGGMRQRVSFLRTVVQNKPVLLLDEPFGALDAITRDELQRWLLEIWQENNWSILLITHDIREAVRLSDRVLVMPANAGSLRGDIRIDRDIPRHDGFLHDPRVAPLEAHLYEVLGHASAQPTSNWSPRSTQ